MATASFESPDVTEKLALLKLAALDNSESNMQFEPDVIRSRKPVRYTTLVEPIIGTTNHGSRHVSRVSHRSSSFRSSHYHEESLELEAKAERHLRSLMEFFSSGAREASTLKECWSQVISRRESFHHERDEWCRQVDELTEQLARYENEGQSYSFKITEKEKHVEKLLLEISVVMSDLTSERGKVKERDHDIVNLRRELLDFEERYSRRETEFHKVKTEMETFQHTIKVLETERNSARELADQHHRDLQRVTREVIKVNTKLTEMTSKHESVRRELTICEREREERSSELLRVTENYERVSEERNDFKDKVDECGRREKEHQRHILIIEESLRKTETTLTTTQTELYREIERVKQIQRERDTAIHEHGHTTAELTELRSRFALLKVEITTLSETRNQLRFELETLRHSHEHEHFNIHLHEDFIDLEHRYEHIQSLLRETRTERDRAVSARSNADRERDEANSRYEEKCRQWDRFDEGRSISFHGHGHSHGHVHGHRHRSGGQFHIPSNPQVYRAASASETVLNHGNGEGKHDGTGNGVENEEEKDAENGNGNENAEEGEKVYLDAKLDTRSAT